MIRFYLFAFLIFPFDAQPQTITGVVTAVIDGNTLEVRERDGEVYRVVLSGIDCPELTQPYGEEAKELVERQLMRREVIVRIDGKDRDKNYIGVVLVDTDRDIRVGLLTEGFAWTAERNPLPELESLRDQAVRDKKGLWRDDAAIPPWVYRRQQSMAQPKSR